MTIDVTFFKKDDSPGQMRVGKAICPKCQQKVLVVNDDGINDNRTFDYLANHGEIGELCQNSEKFIKDLYRCRSMQKIAFERFFVF